MTQPSLDVLAQAMAKAAWEAECASRAYGTADPAADGPTLLRLYNDLRNARARAHGAAQAYFLACEQAEVAALQPSGAR